MRKKGPAVALVNLDTLALGQHFKLPDWPDIPGWEGILVHVGNGSASIYRLRINTETGTPRTTRTYETVARSTRVIPLDRYSQDLAERPA